MASSSFGNCVHWKKVACGAFFRPYAVAGGKSVVFAACPNA
jgi:hypothetical protein